MLTLQDELLRNCQPFAATNLVEKKFIQFQLDKFKHTWHSETYRKLWLLSVASTVVCWCKLAVTHWFHCFFCFFFFIYFFYWRIIALKILLFSVKPQHKPAIGTHISPPFWTSLPSPSQSHPSRLIQSLCLSFLSGTSNSHWLSTYIW